jgi:hypothetical protein
MLIALVYIGPLYYIVALYCVLRIGDIAWRRVEMLVNKQWFYYASAIVVCVLCAASVATIIALTALAWRGAEALSMPVLP